ncbi:hypothetical protein BJX64DRAFT_268598 [Aspergillus heterothallicus]
MDMIVGIVVLLQAQSRDRHVRGNGRAETWSRSRAHWARRLTFRNERGSWTKHSRTRNRCQGSRESCLEYGVSMVV